MRENEGVLERRGGGRDVGDEERRRRRRLKEVLGRVVWLVECCFG